MVVTDGGYLPLLRFHAGQLLISAEAVQVEFTEVGLPQNKMKKHAR